MNENLNLDKDKKYLVGVSGGSDSMTLLSLCVKEGLNVLVCHVNYKLRKNADKEEEIVRKFCQENSIAIFVLYPKQTDHQNFQLWAREARYDFYQKVYQENNCDCLLLGHQKDDSIENYLMSQKRNSHGWFYGIEEETYHHNMHIIRPLLSWRKEETRQYCLANDVPFGDDESNFTDHYTRNQIRHQLVETASNEQITSWQEQIAEFDAKQKETIKYLENKYCFEEIALEDYKKEEDQRRHSLLRLLLAKKIQKIFAQSFINEIDRVLLSNCDSALINVDKDYKLVKEYGSFYLCENFPGFSYQLNDGECLKTPYFEIKESGEKIEQLTVKVSDYPLTIRSFKKGDVIELRYGHKKVNRFFIDRKIKYQERMKWPVVENKDGKVIFVSGIGCDVSHYSTKPNLFVIQ